MIKTILASVAALALTATPALAQNENFTGIRAEIAAGIDDVTSVPESSDVVYSGAVGFDVPIGNRLIAGVEANVDNVFQDERTIGASARLGYAINSATLIYGKAGYSNYQDVFSRKLDGLRVGGGLEFTLGKNAFVKGEYRYTDFEDNVGSHGALVGVGLRF